MEFTYNKDNYFNVIDKFEKDLKKDKESIINLTNLLEAIDVGEEDLITRIKEDIKKIEIKNVQRLRILKNKLRIYEKKEKLYFYIKGIKTKSEWNLEFGKNSMEFSSLLKEKRREIETKEKSIIESIFYFLFERKDSVEKELERKKEEIYALFIEEQKKKAIEMEKELKKLKNGENYYRYQLKIKELIENYFSS